jgi:hypothetical protein
MPERPKSSPTEPRHLAKRRRTLSPSFSSTECARLELEESGA